MAETTTTPTTEPAKAIRVGDVMLRPTERGAFVVLVRHNRIVARVIGHPSGSVSLSFIEALNFDLPLVRDIVALADLLTVDRATGAIIPKDQA